MTIKDIAKKANVSVATVSRVINDYKWIGEETRARVMKVIEEEHYRPSYTASAMATGKSNVVAIVTPDIISPFFAQFTGIVTKRLKEAGYATMLFQTDNDSDEEMNLLTSPFARMADGIISVTDGVENDLLPAILEPLRENNKPVLFVDRYIPANIADCVINDNFEGMYKAVELLYKNGHTKIGMIIGRRGLTVVHDKMKGFRSAMRHFGIPINENYIRSGDWTVETGRTEMKSLLDLQAPPTAVIACNNFICEGALQIFSENGLHAGKNISIIGMEESDSDARLFSHLGITTLKLNCTTMAQYASDYMIERLQKGEKQEYYTTAEYIIEMIERSSVVNLTPKKEQE